MNVREYRPEIDGLRAVSVLAVVSFHLGWESVPGGFVGVDVFFVISGYLITGIILRSLREGRFSLKDFWVRRIRRIMPASVVMALGTMLVGAYLLTPGAFEDLGRTLLVHVLLASNCYFSQDQGYFADSAEMIPLLHTWSLAVEEQFYLILPLMLILVWRLGSKWVLPILAGLAIWSLVWSYFKMEWDPREGFFLLPPRAWELLAGSILAALPRTTMSHWLKELLAGLGMGLILYSIIEFDEETVFPGLAALPPVLGAALFLLANEGGRTWMGKALSLGPFVRVGLISYSLYLWHWPVCVFTRMMVNEELTLKLELFVLATSFLLAWLSWKFVETPFRTGGLLKTQKRAFGFAGASALALLAVSATVLGSGGMPGRFSERMRLMMEDVDWEGEEWTEVEDEPVVFGAKKSGPPDFVIWGDSHGVAAMAGLVVATENLGMTGWAYLNNGTPPVPGIWRSELVEKSAGATVEMNEMILEKIIGSGTKEVMVISRWVARCEGYNEVEMKPFLPDYQVAPMAVNRVNHQPSVQESTEALLGALTDLSQRLNEHGIRLWLLQQVPESSVDFVAWKFYAATRFPWLYSLEDRATSLEYHLARERRTMTALRSLPEGTIRIIDPTWSFFPSGGKEDLKIHAERSYYRDDDHLSRVGSVHYLAPVFEKVLPEMQKR